ncbi:hypothetical protein DyAD56_21425 [Dyella sp. AD56]|nr:hypothetical protein DyAD56_21425 [Dyella sp. AD56]
MRMRRCWMLGWSNRRGTNWVFFRFSVLAEANTPFCSFLPLPYGERVGVRGGCSPRRFIFSRHPGVGRDPVSVVVGCRFVRYRDLAAYAAGVSIVCRRREASPRGTLESLFFVGPKKSNQKKWPDRPTPAAFLREKPERLRTVATWQPSPLHSGYFGTLRNAPMRRGLKAGFATLPNRCGELAT